MKRPLAITAVTAMLALSLAGCGAERYDSTLDTADGANIGGTTATDTMHNDTGTPGTGMTSGASTNDTGLGGVAGAVNRASRYGTTRYDGRSNAQGNSASYGVGGPNSGAYTATNNGGLTASGGSMTGSGVDYSNEAAVKRAARQGDNYARMLENARVHDTDGFLFDGENASYRTF